MNHLARQLLDIAESIMASSSPEKSKAAFLDQAAGLFNDSRIILASIKRKRILFVSGGLTPSQDNEFAGAIKGFIHTFSKQEAPRIIREQEMDGAGAPVIHPAPGTLGRRLLWAPMAGPCEKARHALIIALNVDEKRDREIIDAFSFASPFLAPIFKTPLKRWFKNRRKTAAVVMAAFALTMMIPIHSRIHAPAQVVPRNPHYLFAPFDGIIKTLFVYPGQTVKTGDVIFAYDIRDMEREKDEASHVLAASNAELARLEGASYGSPLELSKIPAQKIEINRRRLEVDFIARRLALSKVRSRADGVIILDDPDALIGTFVETGQLVLRVADPEKTKIRIMVPASDSGAPAKGARVVVRLDDNPFRSIEARVERMGFDVVLSDEYVPSVIFDAAWKNDSGDVHPGQRGTARIMGPKTFLGLQLFRKPMVAARIFFGI